MTLADIPGPGVVRRLWCTVRGEPEQDDKWENFEAPQDVCATAYWYQTLPSPALPAIAPYAERRRDLALPPLPPKK